MSLPLEAQGTREDFAEHIQWADSLEELQDVSKKFWSWIEADPELEQLLHRKLDDLMRT